MRIFLVSIAIVAGLLALGDFGLRRYEESRVANSIESSLHLAAQPDVSLHGFPFTSELARGQISTATITAGSITAGSLRFSDIHLKLRDVQFSLGQLLNGNLARIHAAGGAGDASLTTASVNAYLRAHGAPFQVGFQGGQTIARLGPLSARIDVTMKISNGTLLISPGSGSFPQFSVPLPAILHRLSYGSAKPGSGRLILNFRLQHPTLNLQH